jgi:hypothetical protein
MRFNSAFEGLKKPCVIMLYARRKPSINLSVSRRDGFQSMMKSALEDLRPEPRVKMWQKFDIEDILHKEFVPLGQTVNVKFCCEILRRLMSKHPAQTSIEMVQQLLGST